MKPAEVAAEAWDLGGKLLVGTLDGKCSKAPSDAQKSAARAAIRKLPQYQEIQKSWRNEGHKGAWEESETASVDIHVFGKWLSVVVTAGEGCGGFGGDLFALFDVAIDGDGVPELLYHQTANDFGVERGYVRPHADRADEHIQLEIPFLDCPC